MFGFKKRGSSKNLRGRTDLDEEEDAPIGSEFAKTSTTNLLSFYDDEEETVEVFKVKKKKRRPKPKPKSESEDDDVAVLPSTSRQRSPDSSDVKPKPVFQKVVAEADSTTTPMEPEDDETNSGDELKKMLEFGVIPDAKAIHLARKKRQLARNNAEYIPLEQPKPVSATSRLVREEDEEDVEEAGFLGFGHGRAQDEEKRRLRDAEFLEQEQGDSDDERDQEFDKWEAEQLRKAMITSTKLSEVEQEMRPTFFLQQQEEVVLKAETRPRVQRAKTAGEAIDRLKEVLASRKSAYQHSQRELDNITDKLVENESTLSGLEGSVPQLETRFQTYQKMQMYCLVLIDCWKEKLPTLHRLEKDLMSAYKRRLDFFVSRRRQDVQDEYQECFAAASAKQQEKLRQDPERCLRVTEREARRARRRAHRGPEPFGMSSDEEETMSHVAAYETEVNRCRLNAENLFDDVSEDFSCVDAVVDQLQEWVTKDRKSFDSAYISHCIPKMVLLLISKELLCWNPILARQTQKPVFGTTVSRDIDDVIQRHPWHQALLHFAVGLSTDSPGEDDTATNAIPLLVDKVVVPYLTRLLQNSWNPCSSKETTRLTTCLRGLLETYPTLHPRSKAVQGLLKVIVEKLKATLDDDLFIPMFPKQSSGVPSPAQDFADRQFWFTVKILRNVLMWRDILDEQYVAGLALDSITNRYLILALQADASETKYRALIKSIPRDWYTKFAKQLEPLARVSR